jgi:hypothetical protein
MIAVVSAGWLAENPFNSNQNSHRDALPSTFPLSISPSLGLSITKQMALQISGLDRLEDVCAMPPQQRPPSTIPFNQFLSPPRPPLLPPLRSPPKSLN